MPGSVVVSFVLAKLAAHLNLLAFELTG